MIQTQLQQLSEHCASNGVQPPVSMNLSNGGMLIRIPAVRVTGWHRPTADVLFVAPPGYPAPQPDFFSVHPTNFRPSSGPTPNHPTE